MGNVLIEIGISPKRDYLVWLDVSKCGLLARADPPKSWRRDRVEGRLNVNKGIINIDG